MIIHSISFLGVITGSQVVETFRKVHRLIRGLPHMGSIQSCWRWLAAYCKNDNNLGTLGLLIVIVSGVLFGISIIGNIGSLVYLSLLGLLVGTYFTTEFRNRRAIRNASPSFPVTIFNFIFNGVFCFFGCCIFFFFSYLLFLILVGRV